MPYDSIAELVLARWRAAMLQLDVIGPDAASFDGLRAYAASLEDQYRSLVDAAIAAHATPPPPFPDDPFAEFGPPIRRPGA